MDNSTVRYQQNKEDVAWHNRFVGSQHFERAADAALLCVIKYAANHDRIVGAQEFIKHFTELSKLPSTPKVTPKTQIDYTKL